MLDVMKATILVHAQLPAQLMQAFLQHIRDFDATHTGCHFGIIGKTDSSSQEIEDMVRSMTPAFAWVTLVKTD